MAKTDTDTGMDQAVQALLTGLGLKRKQELIERNDRLRFQFLQTQKMAAGKAREGQINTFLAGVVPNDKKVRELVFQAWIKDNAAGLGEVPEFPERFKAGSEPSDDEEGTEADVKDATAAFKKWLKATDFDLVNAYARLGPYEFPAKVLTAVKAPKAKTPTAALEAPAEGLPGEAPAAAGGVPEAVVTELKKQLEDQKAAFEAKLQKAEDETTKFKRLLEENKEKRKTEIAEVQDKAKSDLASRQADWQRTEAQLRKEIGDLQKARQESADKTSKARDELLPLRQQLERAEKEAKRAANQLADARTEVQAVEEERARLAERVKVLESAQAQLVAKEKQLERLKTKGAAVMLTATDNLKIWEEALNEQEVKEAFRRTFNPDTIKVSQFEHDERDLQDVWKKLIQHEQGIVDRFFALPFDELTTPTDEFRELITNFIELKDSLVAREQLAHMINFTGNRFLSTLKQKV